MIEKVDHIAIAVKDIDESLKFFCDGLGLSCKKIEEVEGQKVKVAFIPAGDTNIELVQATDPESAVAKFIEKKGEGIQHVALRVKDIEKAIQFLKDKGVELIDAIPRKGAHGSKIVFLHPKSSHGALIELVER
ncbi:MAG: methylmalonyl-CoA epimerase [Candidatus Altiarchaeales archaeon WOR_SM1_86-2]|nr:MAG: methylmalonyl-CoA epimerase [Candidatus Altiarchaeales archaeon WOR_SM1_86-2]